MDIFIYSDESGVFDYKHNDYYIFGGVMFLSKNEKDISTRKYINVERTIARKERKSLSEEIKADNISYSSSSKIFRSLNQVEKFGVVVRQKFVTQQIFENKKAKQRYLDYVYKICLKRKFESLINNKQINPEEISNIYILCDEHTTATNGRYELREGLLQEFKEGTYNETYSKFFEPIFPNINTLDVHYCNSKKTTLIRAADIVANRIFKFVYKGELAKLQQKEKFNIIYQP